MSKSVLKTPKPDGDHDIMEDLITRENLCTSISSLKELVKENAELRLRFQHDPSRFMESEERLYAVITSYLSISTEPLCLRMLNKNDDFFRIFVGLTFHENTDIVGAVIDIFKEIVDPCNAGDEVSFKEGHELSRAFIDKLVEHKFFDVLLGEIQRCEEELVQEIMGMINDVLEIHGEVNLQAWMPWLVGRFLMRGAMESKYLAAELIATLLLDEQYLSPFIEADGVECTLTVLSAYKKRDPGDSEEMEYMENALSILCTLDGEGKERLIEANGFDVLIDLISALNMSRLGAVKVLGFLLENHAVSVQAFCSKGLGLAFSLFMQKDIPKFKAKYPRAYDTLTERVDEGHIIGIMADICRVCTERAKKKFAEPGKMERLRGLQKKYANEGCLSDNLIDIGEILDSDVASNE